MNDAKADDDAKDIGIFSFDDLDNLDLAFDHRMILNQVKEYFDKE